VEKPCQMQYVFYLFIAEIFISGTLPTFIIILQTKFEAMYMAEWPDQGKIKTLQHCHMRICCARLTFGMNKKLICCAPYLCLKKLFFILLAHLACEGKMCFSHLWFHASPIYYINKPT
jgi:hypothetical protein